MSWWLSEAPRNSAVARASVSPFGKTTAKDHLASPESLDEGGSSPFKERGSLAKASGSFILLNREAESRKVHCTGLTLKLRDRIR